MATLCLVVFQTCTCLLFSLCKDRSWTNFLISLYVPLLCFHAQPPPLSPLFARIQIKVLTLFYRSYIGQSPKCLCDIICLPSSATPLHLLFSLDWNDLFVPWVRTSMAKTWALAFIHPALKNQLPPLMCSFSFHSLNTAPIFHGSLALEVAVIGGKKYLRCCM